MTCVANSLLAVFAEDAIPKGPITDQAAEAIARLLLEAASNDHDDDQVDHQQSASSNRDPNGDMA